MGMLNIRPAVRELAKIVIGLSAESGGGKTYTALLIAMGMVRGDASKIGLLDTENKRGSLYADMFAPKSFMVGDLEPPFSPARYIEAIEEFEKAGVEVLIIDSVSHEWEGEGGCGEMAEGEKTGWLKPKKQHKKFVNKLLQSNMHIIACTRAREKVKVIQTYKNNKLVPEYEAQGVMPICEKNFMYEMTCSMMMMDSGQKQRIMKSCEGLKIGIGEHEGFLGVDVGTQLIDWVDGHKSAAAEHLIDQKTIMMETNNLAELEKTWKGLSKAERMEVGADFIKAQKKRLAISPPDTAPEEEVSNDAVQEAGL